MKNNIPLFVVCPAGSAWEDADSEPNVGVKMTERLTEDLRAAYKKGQIKIDTHRPFIYDILRT
jgi:hypothetical protein